MLNHGHSRTKWPTKTKDLLGSQNAPTSDHVLKQLNKARINFINVVCNRTAVNSPPLPPCGGATHGLFVSLCFLSCWFSGFVSIVTAQRTPKVIVMMVTFFSWQTTPEAWAKDNPKLVWSPSSFCLNCSPKITTIIRQANDLCRWSVN